MLHWFQISNDNSFNSQKISNPVVGWLEWLYLNVQKETVEKRISQSSMKNEVPLCNNIVGRLMVKQLRHKISLTLQFIIAKKTLSCINLYVLFWRKYRNLAELKTPTF